MSRNTSHAVMAQRAEPHDSLDFFPTPPWATRALCEHLNRWGDVSKEIAWEPACGEGHMVRPLREYFARVHASDVHDYGGEQEFTTNFPLAWDYRPPVIEKQGVDWIITNPPFRLAEEFALTAIAEARTGVALLVRTAFLEGGGRHERLFKPHPPEWILQFCERVPMVKGRLDSEASSATAYCWVIWTIGAKPATHFPAFVWIPPCRKRLERPDDYRSTVC